MYCGPPLAQMYLVQLDNIWEGRPKKESKKEALRLDHKPITQWLQQVWPFGWYQQTQKWFFQCLLHVFVLTSLILNQFGPKVKISSFSWTWHRSLKKMFTAQASKATVVSRIPTSTDVFQWESYTGYICASGDPRYICQQPWLLVPVQSTSLQHFRTTLLKKMKFQVWDQTVSKLVKSTQKREVGIEKKIIFEFVDINQMAELAVVIEFLACDWVEVALFSTFWPALSSCI